MKLKQIDEFDTYYVCDSGVNEQTILSTYINGKKRIKWLKPELCKNGYYYINLCRKGKIKHITLHRLIAEAFIPNPDNKPCIDHINGNRADNRVENLRWCTPKENNNNPIAIARTSRSMEGNKNHYGKHHTEEAKRKISESKKRILKDNERIHN